MSKKISKLEAVRIINSIKDRYPELRQSSKSVSFASLYGGTYQTLVNNCGFNVETAKNIVTNYHKLYRVSDTWKEARLQQASKDGYVDVAFGLRVRTPLLKQVVYGSKKMPYEASNEARTVGNAMGQSYCLLNNRASNEFMEKVWKSPYRLDIKPIAQIHDAQYYLVRDDLEIVHWVNQELIKSMQWQELPEIQHPTVKLGATMEIYFPNWSKSIKIPNGASQEEILESCRKKGNK